MEVFASTYLYQLQGVMYRVRETSQVSWYFPTAPMQGRSFREDIAGHCRGSTTYLALFPSSRMLLGKQSGYDLRQTRLFPRAAGCWLKKYRKRKSKQTKKLKKMRRTKQKMERSYKSQKKNTVSQWVVRNEKIYWKKKRMRLFRIFLKKTSSKTPFFSRRFINIIFWTIIALLMLPTLSKLEKQCL